jgi:hypothetical protein
LGLKASISAFFTFLGGDVRSSSILLPSSKEEFGVVESVKLSPSLLASFLAGADGVQLE